MIARAHAPIAERTARMIKNMLHKRMEAKPDKNWCDPEVLSNSLATYNYKNTHHPSHDEHDSWRGKEDAQCDGR